MILSPPMFPIPLNKSWKMYGYYCIFNVSEPAHAPHPTEQIMKNAWILLYFQWFWARPCSPSHRTYHEKCIETIEFAMFLARPCSPLHDTNHEKCAIPLYFQWFWTRPCSPLHQTNHEKCTDSILLAMILGLPMPPFHHPKHGKCMETPPEPSKTLWFIFFSGGWELTGASAPFSQLLKTYWFHCFLRSWGVTGAPALPPESLET